MAAPAKAIGNMTAYPYEVTWNAETIGFTKDVDPSGLQPLVRDQTIGELDNLIVDKWIYGFQGTIKMTLHETVSGRLRQLMKWAGSTGAFTITPGAAPYSMYTNAAALIIHPRLVSGTAEDMQFAKAFPVVSLPKSAGGPNWRELTVEWHIFPDQAALVAGTPTVVGGYVGPLPA